MGIGKYLDVSKVWKACIPVITEISCSGDCPPKNTAIVLIKKRIV